MKTGVQLNLPNVGSKDVMEAGKLSIDEDKVAPYLFTAISATLANASGSSVTLNDAQKQAFLAGYKATLIDSAGVGQTKRIAYDGRTHDVIDTLSREQLGVEMPGYTDATTGAGQAIPNGQSKTVVLYAQIATGGQYLFQGEEQTWGVGSAQAKALRLEITRVADTLPAGVTVSGSVTVEVRPGEAPAHGRNLVSYFPEVISVDETRDEANLRDGVIVYVADTAAAQASQTALQNIRIKVGNKVLLDGMKHTDQMVQWGAVANVPSAVDTRDRWTNLLIPPKGSRLADWPVGDFSLKQITHDLATMHLIGLRFPLRSYAEVLKDIAFYAGRTNMNRVVRAVSVAALDKRDDLSDVLKGIMPYALLEQSDPRFNAYAGILAGPTLAAHWDVPDVVARRTRAALDQHSGDRNAQEAILRSLATQIPGAVESNTGFSGGDSTVLASLRADARFRF